MTLVAPAPTRRRRLAGWVAIGVALLLVGAAGAALSELGRWTERDAMDPESAGPLGTRALVEILRDQGVEVVVARDRESAARDLAGRTATLVLPDAPALSDDALLTLTDRAAEVVLVEPREIKEQVKHFHERVPSTGDLLTADQTMATLMRLPNVVVSALPRPGVEAAVHLRVESVERFSGSVHRVRDELDSIASGDGARVLIACQSEAEVHRLTAQSGWKTFDLHAATALHLSTTSTFRFGWGDYDRDGTYELYALKLQGTGSGTVEVHVLDDAGGFRTWLAHRATSVPSGAGTTATVQMW